MRADPALEGSQACFIMLPLFVDDILVPFKCCDLKIQTWFELGQSVLHYEMMSVEHCGCTQQDFSEFA